MLTNAAEFAQNGEALRVLVNLVVQTGGDFYKALGMFLSHNYDVITSGGQQVMGAGQEAAYYLRPVIMVCNQCYVQIMTEYHRQTGQRDAQAAPSPDLQPQDDAVAQQEEAQTMAEAAQTAFEEMFRRRQAQRMDGTAEMSDLPDQQMAAAASPTPQGPPVHHPFPPQILQRTDSTSDHSDDEGDPFGKEGVSFLPSPDNTLNGGSISKKSKRKTKRKLNKKSKRRKSSRKKSSRKKSSRKKSKRLSRKLKK